MQGQQIGTLYDNRPIFKGLHFALILITSSFASICFGFYSKKFQEVRTPLVCSFIAFGACCAGFSQLQPGTPRAVPYVLCALVGLAFGAPQGLLITLGQLAVSPNLVGLMTSHIIALRYIGGASVHRPLRAVIQANV
jgi:sugar phosphate permease